MGNTGGRRRGPGVTARRTGTRRARGGRGTRARGGRGTRARVGRRR